MLMIRRRLLNDNFIPILMELLINQTKYKDSISRQVTRALLRSRSSTKTNWEKTIRLFHVIDKHFVDIHLFFIH